MKNKINVVIVSYNALDFLKITIDSLFKNTDMNFHLTIVDNNSNYETKKFIYNLQKIGKCNGITKIFNKNNLGYAKAVNIGLENSISKGYDFTCFCNDDLYFSNEWLSGLFSEINDDVVAIYPMGISTHTMLNGESTKKIIDNTDNYETIVELLTEKNEKIIKKILKENKSSILDKFPQMLPDHCVLVNNDFIKQVGYWADEKYGLYGSNDVDICWEIFKRGKKIKETNKSFVYHFRHKSLENNKIDRFMALKNTSRILYDKWRDEFEKEMKKDTFIEDFFNIDNRDYKILRSINEKINFVRQDSTILAVFGGLGKTVLCKKYPNLCEDIEVTAFRYDYGDNVVDYEREKGNPERRKNSNYPYNYISEIGRSFNRKSIINVVLSVEILHLLDRMGVKYDVIYPRKEMKNIIIERMKKRGNSDVFVNKIINTLNSYKEIKEIQDRIKPENIYYAKGDDTLEDILLKEGIVDDLVLNNSSFIYDGIKYRVNFTPCKESDIEKKFPDFTQVYCLGNVDGRALVIYYEKSEGKIFNLPGGTRESGENLEENLRREILEETNCEVLDYKVLGTQINISEHREISKPQIRVFANLRPLGKFVNDPGGSVKGYELIGHDDIEKYIQWGEVGDWLRLKTKKDFE